MNLNRVWKIGAQGDASGAEGILVRKHDWESTTKKAANRSWDKVSAGIFLLDTDNKPDPYCIDKIW